MKVDINPMQAFAPYTDPEKLRGLLQDRGDELFGRRVTVASCTVIDSRYKTYQKSSSWPKSTLSICYRVSLVEPEDSIIFYAKVYLDGRSRAEWERLKPTSGSDVRHAVIYLPTLDMIVWRFPYDPSILHLPEILLPERVRHHLPFDRLPPGLSDPADLTNVTVELVKYYPEKCCTARHRLQWQGSDARASRMLTVYGKTYSNERGRAVHERLQHFWDTAAFKVPQPLGYNGTIQTVWTLGIEGLPLAEVVDRLNYKHYLGQVGRCLAAVHASDLGGEAITVAELLADCIKKIDKLSLACPPCAAQLAAAAPALQRVGERLEARSRPGRTLYGDFHIGQMLAHGSDVYFFDLDSFAVGDPERDLAEFIVSLLFYEVEPQLVCLMTLALVESYRVSVSWKIEIDRLYWYALVEYVTRAYGFYRQQRPGWAGALQRSLTNLPSLEAAILELAA